MNNETSQSSYQTQARQNPIPHFLIVPPFPIQIHIQIQIGKRGRSFAFILSSYHIHSYLCSQHLLFRLDGFGPKSPLCFCMRFEGDGNGQQTVDLGVEEIVESGGTFVSPTKAHQFPSEHWRSLPPLRQQDDARLGHRRLLLISPEANGGEAFCHCMHNESHTLWICIPFVTNP